MKIKLSLEGRHDSHEVTKEIPLSLDELELIDWCLNKVRSLYEPGIELQREGARQLVQKLDATRWQHMEFED